MVLINSLIAQSEIQAVYAIGSVRKSGVYNLADEAQVVNDNRHGICRLVAFENSLAVVRVAIDGIEAVIAGGNVAAFDAERND